MTTWNPADKAANITLSGGNLTAAVTSSAVGAVRGTDSHASGKWYFEVAPGANPAGSNWAFGLGVAGATLSNYIGSTAGTVGGIVSSEQARINGASIGTITFSAFTGHTYECAVDIDGKLIWYRYDAQTWNAGGDPALGTGGYSIAGLSGFTLFPMWSSNNASDLQTANFGATSFAFAPPSGFSAWGGGATVVGRPISNFPLLGLSLVDMVGPALAIRMLHERRMLTRRRLGRLLLPW